LKVNPFGEEEEFGGLTFFGNKAILGGFVLLGFILHGVNMRLANNMTNLNLTK
jgi:hypothetical protein